MAPEGLAGFGARSTLAWRAVVCAVLLMALAGGTSWCSLSLRCWRLRGGAFGCGTGLPSCLLAACSAAILVGVGGIQGLPPFGGGGE